MINRRRSNLLLKNQPLSANLHDFAFSNYPLSYTTCKLLSITDLRQSITVSIISKFNWIRITIDPNYKFVVTFPRELLYSTNNRMKRFP